MKISTDKLFYLCNKYQWFTNGDCKQYDMLFDRIIWICSSDWIEQDILKILKQEADL